MPLGTKNQGDDDDETTKTGGGACTKPSMSRALHAQRFQEHCMVCKKSVCFWDGKGSGDLECQWLNSKMISDKIHSSYIKRIEIIFFEQKISYQGGVIVSVFKIFFASYQGGKLSFLPLAFSKILFTIFLQLKISGLFDSCQVFFLKTGVL